jgi:hypothetical protein
MMIPSEAKNDSAFTVTIGGVDLCLTPSPDLSTDDASAMLISLSRMSDGEVFIDLNGFVGTLALRTKKNHKSTKKGMNDESSEASTSPTSITIDTVPAKNHKSTKKGMDNESSEASTSPTSITIDTVPDKNHKSTKKDMDNESSKASTLPTSITIDTVPDSDGFESYLLDLIREILFDCGGITQCRQLGRNLCTSRGYHDASKSALHELKETFGSLTKFLKLHEDSFLITEAVNKADDIVSLSGKESCIKRASSPCPFLKRCDSLLTQEISCYNY